MKKTRLVLLLCTALMGGFARAAHAQVYTPTYMAPRPSSDLGLYLSSGPGSFALEGIWRRHLGGYDLGFRAGVANEQNATLLVGAELRNPFAVTGAPVDFAFTAGVQAKVSRDAEAGFLAGLSVGHTFVPGTFRFTPYIHPRVGLVSGGRDGLTARVLADIGLNFDFQPNLSFRVGFGLARETADWGVGLAWR